MDWESRAGSSRSPAALLLLSQARSFPPAPHGRRRLDFLFLGRVRAQPPREILPLDQTRTETTRSRNQPMGPYLLGYRSSFGSIVERCHWRIVISTFTRGHITFL